MLSCKINFKTGLVYLGHTVLDQWTDEVFMKRVFADFQHTHDFTGAAVYEAPIAMHMDDCYFNRIMIVFHLKIRQDTATSISRGGMPSSFHLLCTVH